MTTTLWRVELVHGDEFSFPTTKPNALAQVHARMSTEPLGDPLKVVRIEYELNPTNTPDPHTRAIDHDWRGCIERFPSVGQVGLCVDKPDSQHRKANAIDWTAPRTMGDAALIDFLWQLFEFGRAQGRKFEDTNGREGLPVSEVITRDRIATRATEDWKVRPYPGTFHATHCHWSGFPLLPTTGASPC